MAAGNFAIVGAAGGVGAFTTGGGGSATGAFGIAFGVAAIFGGAGGVGLWTVGFRMAVFGTAVFGTAAFATAAFRVAGFRLIFFGAAFGAAVARLMPDGGFSLIRVPADAPLPDMPRGVAGANRDAAGGGAFGISNDRMPFRISCGTLLGLPS